MNITSAQYHELKTPDDVVWSKDVKATIDGVDMFVPIDTANRHYVEIKTKHDDTNDSFTIQAAS